MIDKIPADDAYIVLDATFATMRECEEDDEGYGLIPDGAAIIDQGRVAWMGRRDAIPPEVWNLPTWSAEHRLITPGLVECHSHLIFAGDRRECFAQRAAGRSYSDVVWEGRGFSATVAATRAATEDELFAQARRRLDWFVSGGVTTIEVKSGYGLDVDNELKMLHVGRRLGALGVARVLTTLLAGHLYPFGVDQELFVEEVCTKLIPKAHEAGLCDAVEVYCEESIGISLDDASTILESAYKRKIPTRIIADHLSDSAGAALAPAFYAKSAAHLNFTDDVAVAALASTNTTPILLPIPYLELGCHQRPPIDRLRECGIPMAVSTGCNPGLSPTANLLTAAHFACTAFGLSPLEAMRGITVCAARALGMEGVVGQLNPGTVADFAIWDAEHPEELIYWLNAPICHSTWLAAVSHTQHQTEGMLAT